MADVERALLSAAINSGRVHDLVARGISSNLFSAGASGQECSAVLDFAVAYSRAYGQSPTQLTVQRHFPKWHGDGGLNEPLEALVDEFLDLVRKRYFEAAVLELSNVTKDPSTWGRLDEIMLDAARDVISVVPSGTVSRFSTDLERRIDAYEEQHGRTRPGIYLGIPVIDELTQGVRCGWLVTNAGYSSRGKSYLTLYNLLTAFEQDKVALMLSLEMSSAEVMERLDTMVMHFKHRDLVNRSLSSEEVTRWRDVARVYSKAKGEIVVVDKLGGCTIDRVHAEISRYKPDICAVDYVQRMSGTKHSMSRWEGLEEITNDLKTVAMDTDTAVIMVSQDNRASAEQGSTETNMGGSVSVYQAADLYFGMFADDAMRGQDKMRIRLIKNRHGPRSEVDMFWSPATGTFGKWESIQRFVKPGAELSA